MSLAEVLNKHYRSVAVVGLGKNTGKTFTFNHLVMQARQLQLNIALTTIGLDGELQDSLFRHDKPQIVVASGMIVANAKSLIIDSGLDYEILATTQINTPLGEIVLARVLSDGKTILAGPSTSCDLALIKDKLAEFEVDLFLVDGAVDRRSFSTPLLCDTTVLAVGAEVAWQRPLLLEKLKHHYQLLTLPGFEDASIVKYLKGLNEEIKLVLFSSTGVPHHFTHHDLGQNLERLPLWQDCNLKLVYVRGMLSDQFLTKLLEQERSATSFTILVSDATNIFLGKESLRKLETRGIKLQVLDPIHLSCVTVNPFNSSYGYTDPIQLLADVGEVVHPTPCFDLKLGIRHTPEKEDVDAIF